MPKKKPDSRMVGAPREERYRATRTGVNTSTLSSRVINVAKRKKPDSLEWCGDYRAVRL